MDKLSYSIDEVAAVTGICKSKLYIEIHRGHLHMVKCGRRSIITAEDLKAWLSSLPKVNNTAA